MELTEEMLARALEGAEPHMLGSAIPAVLKPWLLPVKWDQERLWAIRHSAVNVPLHELRWMYDLPLWRGNAGLWFEISPRQFLESPEDHPEHSERVAASDLAYPIHVIRRRNRFFILDGVHRLVRADLEGRDSIAAVVLTAADLKSIVCS